MIPRDIAEAMEVSAGSPIRVVMVGRQLVIEPEDDTIPEKTFRRAFAAVLRRYESTFSGLAAFDRGD